MANNKLNQLKPNTFFTNLNNNQTNLRFVKKLDESTVLVWSPSGDIFYLDGETPVQFTRYTSSPLRDHLN